MAAKTKKTKKTKKAVVKPTAKRGAKPIAKAVKRPTKKAIAKPVRKRVGKPAARPKMKLIVKPVASTEAKPESRPVQEAAKKPAARTLAAKPKTKLRQTRSAIKSAEARRTLRLARMPQFEYMKPPGAEHGFEVGNTVEVFCDHERNSDRIRGWVKGIVVQVDNKLVAVQFRSNVYLTDGWMVPDHILWYPVTSNQIRAETFAKKGSKRDIPEY